MENNSRKYLTVTALNKYIAYKFDSDPNLGFVYLQGELSNIRFSKEHLYFVLKDQDSEISGIMYSSSATKLNFMPKDGMNVLVSGKVSVYQKKGSYNLVVITMSEAGLGALYQDFLFLKDKLEKEGLFAPEHKKPIPEYAEKIGVITSATADAFQDIRSTITERFPLAQIHLYPALVQGSDAPKSLIKALAQANNEHIVDVIIIARGGGSMEDLSCFNDETLARSIFASKIPVVSGVGHETDFTICDFVSDERAPTPTGAAVRVTKNKTLLIQEITAMLVRLSSAMKRILENKFYEYDSLVKNHHFKNFDLLIEEKLIFLNQLIYQLNANSPLAIINRHLERVNDFTLRLELLNLSKKIEHQYLEIAQKSTLLTTLLIEKLNINERNVDSAIDKLILLNPLSIMKKGYTLTYQNNQLLASVSQININQNLTIRFYDGTVEAQIINIKDGENGKV